MAILVSKLLQKALRLINEPGRGATLSGDDETTAFETLQDILKGEAVSRSFQDGVATHFFPLNKNKSVYTYGDKADFDPFRDFDQQIFF